jgi:cyclopropane fatty-acyl-phospholipid synthase-like methyltransferase
MIERERFTVIAGDATDPYQPQVERVYADDPQLWKAAIGDELWFEFGLYDKPDWSLDEAGQRYFERQLELAGLPERRIDRILDVGFGWGTTLLHLARYFPGCPRIDGVNISLAQIRYAAERLAANQVDDRVNLYHCNACDIGLLPDARPHYDLVVMRGCIAHFTMETLNAAISAVAQRAGDGAHLVISDPLYNVPEGAYRSSIDDPNDRLACGNRKTLSMLVDVLERNDFSVRDVQEMPSGEEAIRWLGQVKTNIDQNLPTGRVRAFQEMVDVADNLSAALRDDTASVYSIVARRRQRSAPEPTTGG